jgi:DNA ligase (NAD+)
MIGRTASKAISSYYNDDFNNFWLGVNCYPSAINAIDGIGLTMANSFERYLKVNSNIILELANELQFQIVNTHHSNSLSGMLFVITGSTHIYKNRDELKQVIEENGGKVSGSISKKTSYLINNDITSNSSKNKKAKELGVNIISEDDFAKMISL